MFISNTQKLLSALILLTCFNHAHAWIVSEAIQAVENKYFEAKSLVTERYNSLTEKLHPQPTLWDWQTINTHTVSFPQTFLWGTEFTELTITKNYSRIADCSHNTQHSRSVNSPSTPVSAANAATSGSAKRYKRVSATKTDPQHQINTGTICIDWNKIEPQENKFDCAALDHYALLCQKLKDNNITPIIILFNNSAPQWFTEKKGFLAYENRTLFTRFAHKVFTHINTHTDLHKKKTYWITFLNPNEYAATIYPHNFAHMLNTLEHMLIAHRDVFTLCKKTTQGKNALIGITKNMNTIEAWNKFNPLHTRRASKLNQALHESIYNFFNTGSLNIQFNEITKEDFIHSATHSFDFIGIEYPCPSYADSDTLPQSKNPQIFSPFKTYTHLYGMHPEGLYEALLTIAKKIQRKVPILILQSKSNRYNKENHIHNLYVINKAHKEGCKVIGYITPDYPQ